MFRGWNVVHFGLNICQTKDNKIMTLESDKLEILEHTYFFNKTVAFCLISFDRIDHM